MSSTSSSSLVLSDTPKDYVSIRCVAHSRTHARSRTHSLTRSLARSRSDSVALSRSPSRGLQIDQLCMCLGPAPSSVMRSGGATLLLSARAVATGDAVGHRAPRTTRALDEARRRRRSAVPAPLLPALLPEGPRREERARRSAERMPRRCSSDDVGRCRRVVRTLPTQGPPRPTEAHQGPPRTTREFSNDFARARRRRPPPPPPARRTRASAPSTHVHALLGLRAPRPPRGRPRAARRAAVVLPRLRGRAGRGPGEVAVPEDGVQQAREAA